MKRLGAQWQHESPGGKAVLSCSIHFQDQMVVASLTFTADVVLFAGFSQVASFPLFQFVLPLAPLLCSLSLHHDDRETPGALSRQAF